MQISEEQEQFWWGMLLLQGMQLDCSEACLYLSCVGRGAISM